MAKHHFEQLDSNPNLPAMEKEVTSFWEKENPVKKLKELRKDSKNKVYFDGPITSNGLPHYGHTLTWVLKDVVPRYWNMTGFQVLRNMGWDCQGLPVEVEVEKELKFETKEDIEKFGVEKFNELCRQSVLKYQDAMFKYESLVGRWYDPSEIYSTMDPKYIESMWWSLSELYKKDLLYEGYKVVPYSTRAGTPLSSHEVSEGGYADIEDPFVTVKFKLVTQEDTYFLAWTTTPWTIPANLMLAVGKKFTYTKVKYNDEYYILADERVEEIFKGKEHTKTESFTGEELVGLEYLPPLDFYLDKKSEGCFKVLSSPHVTLEDGTGIVHLAPYGEEDFNILIGLGIKLFDYLNDTAHFTGEIPAYEGMFYKKANSKIIADLEEKGRLFNSGTIIHRMPMCWRTNTPLIYKPIRSWYVAVTKIKDTLIKNNQNIDWHPRHLKDGNSGIWLENARDWALSRNRYWGTPLPIWVNDETSEKIIVGSFEELEKLSGVKIEDPHRPFVDEIFWKDEKNGGTFKRVKDVIDVWYDSGSMPFARFHYPFENKEKFKENFPADYIAEGPDQVRLWFYVMHVLGQALFDKCPYKTVVTNGTMLNQEGKKLSKSKKNYKPIDEVLEVYGGDVLRYFLLNSTITNGEDSIFSEELLRNSRRDFFIPFWNCMRYFTTNAEAVSFDPSEQYESNELLDLWVKARLQETVNLVHSNMEAYKMMDATKALSSFVTDFSTWYVRRSRDTIKDGNKESLSTYFSVLKDFTVLMAPFFPFFAETVFTKLGLKELTNSESVHYLLLPTARVLSEDEQSLIWGMKEVRKIVETAHALRKQAEIPVRQPLSSLSLKNHESWKPYFEVLKDELNVKNIVEGETIVLDTTITLELKAEGEMRDIVRKIQDERKNLNCKLDQKVKVTLPDWPKEFEEEIKKRALVLEIVKGDFKVE